LLQQQSAHRSGAAANQVGILGGVRDGTAGACASTHLFGRRYQPSFNANCNCREVVKVEVMTPALDEYAPDDVNVVITGHPKFV
jgi:hypothetical protein